MSIIQSIRMILSFNSQPHTRLTNRSCVHVVGSSSFNSQPHTRLTRNVRILRYRLIPFNSQPHTRLTPIFFRQLQVLFVFQFTASYEADLSIKVGRIITKSFQFTASYEADQQKFIVFYFLLPYFLTDPLNLPLYLKLSFLKCI